MGKQTQNEAEEFPGTVRTAESKRARLLAPLLTTAVLALLAAAAFSAIVRTSIVHESLVGAVVVADRDFTLTFKKRDGTCASIDTGSPGEHDVPVDCP